MKKLLILVFLTFFSINGYCCDCAEKPSIEKNWERASQIFIGKVVKVDSSLYGGYGEKVYSFTIKIKKSFKGDIYNSKNYRTILYVDYAACDFPFVIGAEYLIYARQDNWVLHCSLCSRTNLLNDVSEDELNTLADLQKGELKNRNEIRIIKLQNNTEYQIDLVKNSFEESLKRKDLLIYALSGTSIFLLLIITLLLRRRKQVN
jgi:hypothetical protein